MMNETTAEQLRRVILEIRRKPYPIKDLIPLLDKAATDLEKSMRLKPPCDNYGRCNCKDFCSG